MIINHNNSAMNLIHNMNNHQSLVAKAMKTISTGQIINSAMDDAAGLCVSEGLRARINGLNQEVRNEQDSISSLQTADVTLNETHSILQRMRVLAVKAASGTTSDQDRKVIQVEMNQLTSAINGMGNNADFNTKQILKSTYLKDMYNRMNIDSDNQKASYTLIKDLSAVGLGISGKADGTIVSRDGTVTAKYTKTNNENPKDGVTNGNDDKVVEYALDLTDKDNAGASIKILDDAIDSVSCTRGCIGAEINLLQFKIDYHNTEHDSLVEKESRIRDADVAKQMLEYTKQSTLTQACQALFAQTGKSSESTIELLKSL